jgi:hypothetical protein
MMMVVLDVAYFMVLHVVIVLGWSGPRALRQ